MSMQPQSTPPQHSERRKRSRFDSMKVWDEASGALLANREVLLAVLGVFAVLPVFALMHFLPLPEPAQGQPPAQVLSRFAQYFDANWLWFALALVVEVFGMLVALVLLGDPARPTVGQAMRQALRAAPSFLAALIAAHAVALLAALVPITIIGLIGSLLLTQVAAIMGTVFILYMMVRFAFIGPVVVLGKARNPLEVLQRSFQATKGIGWQLLVFLLLIYFAFAIVGWLVQGGFAILAALLGGAEAGRFVANLVGGLMQGAQAATFVAVIAASYRQLGEPAR
ncbi:MAG: hypothetical protein ACKOOL_05775 [Novosphingobium sp.]